MSISDHTASILELPKILERLAGFAGFSGGRALALGMVPSSDLRGVRRALEETVEGRTALRAAPNLGLGGVHDIRPQAEAAAKGVRLDARTLLLVADTIRGGDRVRGALAKLAREAPGLAERAALIEPLRTLREDITRSIGEEAEILDSASAKLAEVRAGMKRAQERLLDRLERMIASPKYRDYLQEPIYTERSGRYVLPVKQEQRSAFEGVVHDVSASGLTVFMEPLALVELNNRWRELRVEEKHEEERVLQELSAHVGAEAASLDRNVEVLAGLDLALAKARFADAIGAVEPEASEDRSFRLAQARHPLLGEEAVPIDIHVEGGREGFRALLITGPNTGGKTVALKTVGLLHLMAACGLHIPADEGSKVGVFGAVFADIGDEQSIEQSLSTFSSHMRNLVEMVSSAGDDSLVLADEIGAGTDPEEGAALAQAIVERLLENGCVLVATTHFAALKSFAFSHPLVENASVEFDLETLSPTFRLSVGLAGSSNALEIASRLGLDASVVQRARALTDVEHRTAEEIIAQMRARADEVKSAADEARSHAAEAEESRRKAAQAEEEAAARIDEEWRRARREAAGLLREMHELGREARRAAKHGDSRVLIEAIASAKRAQERFDLEPPARSQANGESQTGAHFAPGDSVRVRGVRGAAEVVAAGSGGEVEVALGQMRMRVAAADLELVARAQPRRETARAVRPATKETPPLEADLRGVRAEDAAAAVDKLLDDALLQGRTRLRVIHGKGTGALRKTVRDFLKDHPTVKSFKDADQREGGSGVTEVELGA